MTESPPKMEGRNAFLIVAPDPLKIKDYLKANPKAATSKDEDDDLEDDSEKTSSKTSDKTSVKTSDKVPDKKKK
jgi:hypothetical protein